MSKHKSVSGRKGSLRRKGVSNQKSQFIDGYEEKAKGIIQSFASKILSEEEFSPALLVYMVECLYFVMELEDKIKRKEIEEYAIEEVKYQLRPIILHFADLYSGILEAKINSHSEDLINLAERDIPDEKDWKENSFVQYVMNMKKYKDMEEKIDISSIEKYPALKKSLRELEEKKKQWIEEGRSSMSQIAEDFKQMEEDLIEEVKEKEKRKIVLKIIEDDLESEYETIWQTDDEYREIMIKAWDDLGWFRAYDLIKAVQSYLKGNDDSLLKDWIKESSYRDFLTSSNFHSEIIIFKEVEEFIRTLEHHSSTIIESFLEEIGEESSGEFFDLLDKYGDPTEEKWKKKVNKLLQKQIA